MIESFQVCRRQSIRMTDDPGHIVKRTTDVGDAIAFAMQQQRGARAAFVDTQPRRLKRP